MPVEHDSGTTRKLPSLASVLGSGVQLGALEEARLDGCEFGKELGGIVPKKSTGDVPGGTSLCALVSLCLPSMVVNPCSADT